MDKKFKENLTLIAFGVVLFVVLIYYKEVLGFVGKMWNLFLPVTTGLVIALILNVPVTGITNLINRGLKKTGLKINEKIVHVFSIAITLVLLGLLMVFIAYLVIPELINSISSLIATLSVNIPKWIKELEQMDFDTSIITNMLSGVNFSEWNSMLSSQIGNIIGNVSTTVMRSVNFVFNLSISLIISIYALLDKKSLLRKAKEVLYALFREDIAAEIGRICFLTNKVISDFFGGQSIEALILGLLMFAAFTLFGLPYASLIGLLAAVGSFIPYIGATLANIIGSFLVLLIKPQLTILSVIVYQAVQFVETQFIYPRVVGKAVGISPLLTLIAVLVGGKMFGILGVIFSLPLVAVISTLFREYISAKLQKKNIEFGEDNEKSV